MSDQADAGTPPELTPEQEARITRLLAGARHDEPVPADLAARLDGVLADLARDGAATSGPPAPVVDLAARRRRRNAGRLLVAAAAVIVAGVGVGQVVGTGSDDSGATAGSTAPDRSGSASDAGDGADDSAGGSSAEEAAPDQAPLSSDLAAVLPLRLASATLEQDLQAQLSALPAQTRVDLAAPDPAPSASTEGLLEQPGFTCAIPPDASVLTGELLPAYVDDAPVVLALQPAEGGTQMVDVVDCATGETLSAVTVTLP